MLTWRFRPTPDGRVPQEVSIGVRDAVRRMQGKQLVLSLKEQTRVRSIRQNRYYHGVIVRMITDAFREAGNDFDDDDTHEFLKIEVGRLRRKIVTADDRVLTAPGTTTVLTTKEFEDFAEKCRAWAAEVLGLIIPLPNEVL